MKRIENNKTRISYRGNLFQRITNLISTLGGLRELFSCGLRNLLNGFKRFSTNYQLLTTNYFKIPLWGIMCALLFSCVTEERYIGGGILPDEGEKGEVTLTLSARVPGQSTPLASRAMDETAENHIETIDVLIFEVNASGDEEYLYRAQGKNIKDGNTASEKSFDVTLTRQTGSQYRLVVLANASSELSGLEPISVGEEKEVLLEQLIYRNNSQWNASGSSPGSFDPFPMWGESGITPISGNMQITDLRFLRMVARVDVALMDTITNFKLKEVYLYNRPSAGYIVPAMSDTTWTATGSLKVQRATVPGGSVPILSPQQPYLAAGDTACVREIYLMESKAGTSLSDATCVVVGGEYGTSGATTYYRLDFLESDEVTYKDILRNHLYRFTITGVSGAGHASADEAFNAIPINMEAEILEWDESEMSVVVFDGQYMLSVNKEEFSFPREATTASDKHNILLIYTDYDVSPNAGWKIEKIVDGQDTDISSLWLDADSWSGAENIKSTVHLLLQENTTGTDRTGYIHITAGRLSYVVTVTQTTQSGLSLFLYEGNGSTAKEITELVFSGRAGEISAQQFTVEWIPKTESPLINVKQIGDGLFDFGSGSDNLTDNTVIDATAYPGGSRSYTILPPAMTPAEIDPALGGNPFLEKSSRIDFTINNGTSYLTKNIFLRQVNYGMTYETAGKYLMDGNEYSFTVKSNAPWTATVTSNPNNIIQLITTTGGNNITGEEVKFKTIDDLTNPTIYQSKAKITFTSPLFGSVEVEIDLGSAEFVNPSNCYILKPGGIGILIPVSRANDFDSDAIGISDDFTAELLWTDNSNYITDNSNISLITEVGTGSSGHILVLPGTATGNAVVTVRNNSDDEIKWSWHIWVTDYGPDTNGSSFTYNNSAKTTTFMDRNLGATTNTVGSQTSMGLLYQWGRKDPFPGVNATSGSTVLTVYNRSGVTPVPAAVVTSSTGTKTLALTVANPTNFYVSSGNFADWYSSTANTHNDTLWNSISNTKTIYDPCPEGWRVPISGPDTESPWYNSIYGYITQVSVYGGTWTTNVGWNFTGSDYNLGYYPAAGNYHPSTGTVSASGLGYYWSASPAGEKAYHFEFHRTYINPINTTNRGCGFSVRCVRE